jgi:steroid 5-alpha reductase family enzyme
MSKVDSMVRVFTVYVVTLFVGGCSLVLLDHGPLLNVLIADLVATTTLFLFSQYYRNCSLYDAFWSVAPPFIALYWLAVGASTASTLRELLVLALILYWGTRLTLNWAYHWEGMHHEDWRFVDLRAKAPHLRLLIDYFGIHLFQTVQVFLGLLPVYAVYCLGERPFNWLDVAATVVTAGAITLQMQADFQLHRFIRTRQEGEHLATGLWALSRHPNYLGELGFWLGLFLFGVAALPADWYWQVIGVASMAVMFRFTSIPMMEQRSLARRPGYQQVIDTVPMLLPRLRRR